jgi:hypothetical protein
MTDIRKFMDIVESNLSTTSKKVRLPKYEYGKVTPAYKLAKQWLSQHGTNGHEYFDSPDYAGMPKRIASKLSSDEVDFIQKYWPQENIQESIQAGDQFDIELDQNTLIETGILDITEDSILLEADDKALELLAKHGVRLDEISKAKQLFPNWNDPETKEFYDKPTFQRIKSGETEPVVTTDYDTPPSMRKPRFKDYLERRRWELAQAAKKAKGEPTNEVFPAVGAAMAAYRAVPMVVRSLATRAASNAISNAGPDDQGNSGSNPISNATSNANELSNAVDEGELVQGPWMGSGKSSVETDELVKAFLKSRFNSSYLANDENALNDLKNDVKNFFRHLERTNKAFKLPVGKSIEDLVNLVAAKVHNSLTSEINPDLKENRRTKSPFNNPDELQRRAELKARDPDRSLLGKDGIYGNEYKQKDRYGDMYKIAGPKGELPENTDNDDLDEAKYQGRTVSLEKPFLTPDGPKKRSVYVKNAKGNVVKVNFGDKKMRIKKSNPKRRKSFRARHNCKNPGPRWKARYWSCRSW